VIEDIQAVHGRQPGPEDDGGGLRVVPDIELRRRRRIGLRQPTSDEDQLLDCACDLL
jgi:hypothetical protein